MACKHDIRAGCVFCGTCGAPVAHVRCRCGFVCGMSDVFCGGCGNRLAESQRAADEAESAAVEADGRFDLERMAALTAREGKNLESHQAHVTQETIRKLVAKRRKTALAATEVKNLKSHPAHVTQETIRKLVAKRRKTPR